MVLYIIGAPGIWYAVSSLGGLLIGEVVGTVLALRLSGLGWSAFARVKFVYSWPIEKARTKLNRPDEIENALERLRLSECSERLGTRRRMSRKPPRPMHIAPPTTSRASAHVGRVFSSQRSMR